eukprot:COSAG01_NODE_313_length_19043_cov_3.917177_2_plen_221_part_00
MQTLRYAIPGLQSKIYKQFCRGITRVKCPFVNSFKPEVIQTCPPILISGLPPLGLAELETRILNHLPDEGFKTPDYKMDDTHQVKGHIFKSCYLRQVIKKKTGLDIASTNGLFVDTSSAGRVHYDSPHILRLIILLNKESYPFRFTDPHLPLPNPLNLGHALIFPGGKYEHCIAKNNKSRRVFFEFMNNSIDENVLKRFINNLKKNGSHEDFGFDMKRLD